MALTKSELEDTLEELKEHKAGQTELITVYVPAGYDINSVQKQLEAEGSTAKNIKSTSTRKNVMEALDKIVRHLKEFNSTPENGLAIFCGDVSKTEGQNDVQLWSIEPPIPLKMRLYRCDKEFVLDPLEEMLESEEVYGLVVMDRKEATIGVLDGKRIEILQKMTSGIPGKTKAGGQSAQRFHRITEDLTKDFYKRVAEESKKSFEKMDKLKGILVGGPIPTKDEFLDNEYLPTELQKKVIGRIDLGGSDESGIKELVSKSQEILEKQEIMQEKRLLDDFFESLGRDPELTFYTEEKIKKALEYGAVDKLLISRDFPREKIKEYREEAGNKGAEVEIISNETDEGKQFKNLSGIGAILRFKIE